MWQGGAANRNVAFKCVDPFYVNTKNSSYLTKQHCLLYIIPPLEDYDITIPTSNVSCHVLPNNMQYDNHTIHQHVACGTVCLSTLQAIADSGATQIFVMEGMPVFNKWPTLQPLWVMLADGWQVVSTHMCDIIIASLPMTLTGHIIPDLSIASLFGIRVLTGAGCDVMFMKRDCTVKYKGNIILQGKKDPATDLWILPLGYCDMTSHHAQCMITLAALVVAMPMPMPTLQSN